MLSEHIKFFEELLDEDGLRRSGRPAPFHSKLKTILDLCWPGKSLEEQLRLTWITNSVKCSAASRGEIRREIEEKCVSSYVKREIEALPNAYVLALGGKAGKRLRAADVRVNGDAQHPSARPNTNPRASWEEAAKQFRAWCDSN